MKNIREVTRQIAKARGLTLSRLTEMLGYRSKTSLERIMNGTTRESSLVKFEQAMRKALLLSEEECEALHGALRRGNISGPAQDVGVCAGKLADEFASADRAQRSGRQAD